MIGAFTSRMMRAYPVLFSQYLPGRSIEIDAGWESIVEEMCHRLACLDPNFRINQIKEKFGMLTVYGGNKLEPKDICDMGFTIVNAAVERAKNTCCRCGTSGSNAQVSTGYNINSSWVNTACESCIELARQKIDIGIDPN